MHIRMLFAIVPLMVLACGVPKEEHQKALAEQKARYEQEMAAQKAAADAELGKKDQSIGALQTEVKRLGGDLSQVAATAESLEQKVVAQGTELASTKANLEVTTSELEQLRRQRETLERMAAAFKQLALKLKSMIDAGKLEVVTRKGRMTLKLPDNILFPAGSAQLKKDGQEALIGVAQVLKDVPDRDFIIAGHTDNVPVKKGGNFKSNWDLSTARAVEVVKLMIAQGIDPTHLAAAGFGEFDPVGDNGTPEGREKNRRLEIVIMPKIEELPVLPQ